MKLYYVSSIVRGIDRSADYVKDNYVCLDWPGIGDLSEIAADELARRAILTYGNSYSDRKLSQMISEAGSFIHEIEDGDYVLIADGEFAYLGDIGDYYYVEQADSANDGRCHRRGVTWMTRIPLSELNEYVQELLEYEGSVTSFKHPYALSQLDRWIALAQPLKEAVAPPGAAPGNQTPVDPNLIKSALEILKQAMLSDDPERRERAAIAILGYARS
jgi:predicted Mrr-cat superfamily restriction endonuclease